MLFSISDFKLNEDAIHMAYHPYAIVEYLSYFMCS